MADQYPTLIHERVALAQQGQNPTVICRLRSAWVVLGDDQRLPGYTLLLADPVRDNINELTLEERQQFLLDMTIVGDALLEVLSPSIINYAILENLDRALHVHMHPRYDHEEPERRRDTPILYRNDPPRPFDLARDQNLMNQLREAIGKRTEIVG